MQTEEERAKVLRLNKRFSANGKTWAVLAQCRTDQHGECPVEFTWMAVTDYRCGCLCHEETE